MFRGVARIFTHRRAGVTWALVAAAMAGALTASELRAQRQEAFLRGRIAALASRDAAELQADLVSCRAAVKSCSTAMSAASPRPAAAPRAMTAKTAPADPRAVAAQLAGTPPAGFDVCARMESADQAVLKTLERR